MADNKSSGDAKKAKSKEGKMNPGKNLSNHGRPAPQPEWASGLKRLYNSVVEEPLPDSFADLIAKLDASDS
jgi:anti-sigma factor NepR-like protein